jgi:hypothetical protein
MLDVPVARDAREMVDYLSKRSRFIMMRTAGQMRDAGALVQHFNSACRAARMFPALPVSRLLFSLNDSDVPQHKPFNYLYALTQMTAYLPRDVQAAVLNMFVAFLMNLLAVLFYHFGLVSAPASFAMFSLLFLLLAAYLFWIAVLPLEADEKQSGSSLEEPDDIIIFDLRSALGDKLQSWLGDEASKRPLQNLFELHRNIETDQYKAQHRAGVFFFAVERENEIGDDEDSDDGMGSADRKALNDRQQLLWRSSSTVYEYSMTTPLPSVLISGQSGTDPDADPPCLDLECGSSLDRHASDASSIEVNLHPIKSILFEKKRLRLSNRMKHAEDASLLEMMRLGEEYSLSRSRLWHQQTPALTDRSWVSFDSSGRRRDKRVHQDAQHTPAATLCSLEEIDDEQQEGILPEEKCDP